MMQWMWVLFYFTPVSAIHLGCTDTFRHQMPQRYVWHDTVKSVTLKLFDCFDDVLIYHNPSIYGFRHLFFYVFFFFFAINSFNFTLQFSSLIITYVGNLQCVSPQRDRSCAQSALCLYFWLFCACFHNRVKLQRSGLEIIHLYIKCISMFTGRGGTVCICEIFLYLACVCMSVCVRASVWGMGLTLSFRLCLSDKLFKSPNN